MSTTDNHHNSHHQLQYWLALVVIFIISLVTGYHGFRIYFLANGIASDGWRALYCSLQLFVLQSGDMTGALPWSLQLSRFLAPTVTATAFLLALFQAIRQQWTQFMISCLRDHVIIAGLGTKGHNIMEEFLGMGRSVLVLEQNPANSNLQSARHRGCFVLIGDMTNEHTLKKAGVTRAAMIFLLTGDDNLQVNTVLQVYQVMKAPGLKREKPLECILHLQKPELLSAMRSHQLMRDRCDAFNLSVFNIYENSARELFMENPPDRQGIVRDGRELVQLIIFGLGHAGEALALQTALTGHYANRRKPRLFVVDRQAKTKVDAFLGRYPSFTNFCDLEHHTSEADNPQLLNRIGSRLRDPEALTTVVLCFDQKTLNMLLGLQIESMLDEETMKRVQVFTRAQDDGTFAAFTGNIKPYGLPSRIYSQDAFLENSLDKKAMAFHAFYREQRKKESDFGKRPADLPWTELTLEMKDSNRKAADHIPVKLRAVRCLAVGADDPRPEATFTVDEIEMLSEMEHRRWNAERSLAGWTCGTPKNEKARITPWLVDWEKLPENIKDYDRSSVRNIPGILGLDGLKMVRE